MTDSHPADGDIGVLRRSPLVAAFTDAELAALSGELDQSAVPAGTIVVREGDPSDGMFFVLDGEAVVERGPLEIGKLHAADHFGELGLLGLRPRAASVRSVTPLRMGRLSPAAWAKLAGSNPRLALRFLQGVVVALGEQLVLVTDSVGLLLGQRSLPRRMQITVAVGDIVHEVAPGTPAGSLLPSEIDGAPVVAVQLDHRPVSLDAPLLSESSLAPITTASWEGRDVIRRSAGLALLEAAATLGVGPIRLGGSLSAAWCIELDEPPADADALARDLDRALAISITRGAPFREEIWAIEEAASQLEEQGWREAARQLRFARGATVELASCGRIYAVRHGPFLRRTSELAGSRVVAQGGRLFLLFGDAICSRLPPGPCRSPIPAEVAAPRYRSEMTLGGARWLGALGVANVASFNDRCVQGKVSRIIRAAESFHEKRIGALADAIAARADELRIVCVAGPSSSGKTTFLRRLSVQLEVNGIVPIGVSLDDYYVDRAKTPRDDNGDLDFEALEALNLERLRADVTALLRGQPVVLPRYDFATGTSNPRGGIELALVSGTVLVLEGIHGLSPMLLGDAVPRESLFRVFVHPATVLPIDKLTCVSPVDVRLLRRIVRDRHQRSFSAADTISRWASVRRGEQLHIYPNLPFADVVFDSFLAYEPSVLKVFAERYLLEVPRDHAAFPTAQRLRNLADQFVAIHPDHVPPTSLLREFIGGSGFEY